MRIPMTSIKKAVIETEISLYLAPEKGTEVKQRLTISEAGRIWLTGYNFNDDFMDFISGRKIIKTIDEMTAAILLDDIRNYFISGEKPLITDVGSYTVTFFYFDGSSEKFSGSLLFDDSLTFDLCRKIRLNIDIENLFLFDGGEDEEE